MTTHHFFLTKDGGIIEVEADDPNGKASCDAIRQHLDHIATLVPTGRFRHTDVHSRADTTGSAHDERLKDEITYITQATEKGAEVKIASANAEAVSAIHQFVTFQINDHQTGDTAEVSH